MTSGRFHSVSISSISVDRVARQRKEVGDVSELASSIYRRGLIHPIVIANDLSLVAGERRLAACKLLGWTHIAAQYTDDLSAADLRAIELEENIKRLDIPWQDNCLAVIEYHELRLSEDPTWTQEKTGEAIGVAHNTVFSQIKIAEEIRKGNSQIIEAPKYSTARGIIERKEERAKAAELEDFDKIAAPIAAPKAESILSADFLKWAPVYDGPRFNLIHCDFPYGIDADQHVQGGHHTHGGYADTEEHYWQLVRCLNDNVDRLAAQSCHLVFWFSMWFYDPTMQALEAAGWDIDPFPLIWLKSDNVGIIPDPERGPRRIYETALFGSRGDRRIVRSKSNAYAAPTVRDIHMSIKPEPVLRHFFEMFVDENTLMLDPTCGSGSSLRAAESLRAKTVVGLEFNPEFADRARQELDRARKLRAVA